MKSTAIMIVYCVIVLVGVLGWVGSCMQIWRSLDGLSAAKVRGLDVVESVTELKPVVTVTPTPTPELKSFTLTIVMQPEEPDADIAVGWEAFPVPGEETLVMDGYMPRPYEETELTPEVLTSEDPTLTVDFTEEYSYLLWTGDSSSLPMGCMSSFWMALEIGGSGVLRWHRPEENGAEVPVALSDLASNTPYVATSFCVETTRTYTLHTWHADTETMRRTWDGYLCLYAESFDPANPLANVVMCNDDGPEGLVGSQISVELTADVPYYAVVTGFYNRVRGQYALSLY